MWTVIIIVLAILAFIIFWGTRVHDKEVRNAHLDNGGLRKSFPLLIKHLEAVQKMELVSETGRSFTYSKSVTERGSSTGVLTIGVKFDMLDNHLLFSTYKNSSGKQIDGVPISGVDFSSIENIKKSIARSTEKLPCSELRNDRPTSEKATPARSREFIAGWEEFRNEVKGSPLERPMSIFMHRFFIPDGIDRDKFFENWDVLGDPVKGFEEGYGTKSIGEIEYLPPAYDRMFVAAYPDVYLWVQEHAESNHISVLNRLSQMPDEVVKTYFNDQEKRLEFYGSLVSQFKREKGNLECALHAG